MEISYPLGLAYIASYLESMGTHVDIIDSLGLGWRKMVPEGSFIRVGLGDDEFLAKLKGVQPDVVGITCMFTPQANCMNTVAKLVKSIDRDIPVVVGGAHPSSQPLECLENENIDVVVVGEGEVTMAELVEHYRGNKGIDGIKGIYFRKHGEVRYTGRRKLIRDLDALPYPAYHLLPMEEYFVAGRHGFSERGIPIDRWASMITSRGCPFQCCFCSVHCIYGRSWRARSPEKVIEEIEFLIDKYRIKHIFFEDDNLTLDIKRAEKIFDLMIERKLDITWETPNGVRADTLSRPLLRKMKESGCIMLIIGVENGNQQFLNEVIKKRLDLKKVEENARIISEEGIPCIAFYIIGIVGENKQIVNDTIKFARRLARIGIVPRFGIATPHPNTELYDIAKQKGYLLKERMEPQEWAVNLPIISTEDFTPKDLIWWKRKAVFLTTLELMLHKPIKLTKGIMHFVKRPKDVTKLFRRI
ncbi:MAG: B12-binding domain-containing radical SAM protein [Candidatus Bathyarchaeia archaeon]